MTYQEQHDVGERHAEMQPFLLLSYYQTARSNSVESSRNGVRFQTHFPLHSTIINRYGNWGFISAPQSLEKPKLN